MLGSKKGYIQILNEFTTKKINEEKPSYFPLRPSNAGRCTRELAYDLMEFRGKASYPKGQKTAEGDRIFKLGSSVEYHLIKIFEEAFRNQEPKVEIRYKQQVLTFFKLKDYSVEDKEVKGETIEGSLDSVFLCPEWKALVDYKSKKDKFSQGFKTDWDDTNQFLRTHPHVREFDTDSFYIDDLEKFLFSIKDNPWWAMNFLQLNMYFFDEHHFIRSRGVDHAVLIYYNKNDSRLREIRFRPSEAVYKQVETKFKTVQEAVDIHSDPEKVDRDYVLGSSSCAFCSRSQTCWGEDALKPFFKTLKKNFPKDTKWMKPVDAQFLETHYQKYQDHSSSVDQLDEIESLIIQNLNRLKIQKVRFSNGDVYEVKVLKTGGIGGGPRQVLRRSKV